MGRELREAIKTILVMLDAMEAAGVPGPRNSREFKAVQVLKRAVAGQVPGDA